ncbi:MAG: AAA family ATPase [Acidimicrobiia bacterium]|nr:AAA family ATPase [Acidimicrobiia bacterium]
MRCPSCRSAVPDGSRFCSTCGHDLQARADERRVVTVLFGDLAGFTTMAESVDPELVKNLVDRCFERLVRDIVSFGGRVDKIVGDAIVALFGAPVAHEDDAERAVRAALAMQETMAAYRAEVGTRMQLRIGINTGEVLTGAMRAGGDYTAMGDVVNTANRLEMAAPPGEVYVGAASYYATSLAVAYEPVGVVHARGREGPVEAWRAEKVLLLPGRYPRGHRSPLLGRDDELILLRRAVCLAVSRRRASLVLILGDAGVGKTRLADELSEWTVREFGARHVESRCVPYGEANIWYPIGAALRELCEVGEDMTLLDAQQRCGEVVAKVLGTKPESATAQPITGSLLHLMGYEGPLRHLEPQRAREEAGRSLVRFLEGLTADQPLVVRLADLHWADDLVLSLLDDLLNKLSRCPFLLVAGARHLVDPRWSRRPGRYNELVVNLDPLEDSAAEQLLSRLLDGKAISPALRETLLARSGGNPFFLEELVALTDRSELVSAGPEFGADWGLPLPIEQELPETLRGLVAARLDRLSAEEREVVENAAVVGRSGPLFALEKMAAATGSGPAWRAALDRLVDRELLELSGRSWTFRSDLIREVAYSTLTKNDRARRHAGIAVWLEDQRGDSEQLDHGSVDRIAFHYGTSATLASELGGVPGLPVDLTERALRWLGEAGRRARVGEVHVLAARLFSQALDLAGDSATPQRLEFLLGRAEARWGLFELDAAAEDVACALELAARLGDEHGRARALMARAEIEQRRGALEPAHSTLLEALDAFRSLGDRCGEAETLRHLGMTLLFQRDYPDAEATTQAALATFRELGDRRGEAWALQNLAWVAYLSGRVADAEVRIDESAATFTEIDDQAGLAWANGLLAFTRFHQGNLGEAERLAEEILPDTHERGDRFGEAMMLLLTALVRLWSGRTVAAVERAEEAQGLFARIGDSPGQAQAEATSGRALVASGRVAEGLHVLEDVAARSRRAQFLAGEAMGGLALASTALHVGDVDRASAQLAVIVGIDPTVGEISGDERAAAIGLTHLQRGDVDAALDALRPWLADSEADPAPAVLAALALALVARGDAYGGLRAADRVHESPRSTYLDLTHAYIAAGLAHAQQDDTSEVIAAFSAARQLIDRTGDVVAQGVVRLAEAHALTAVEATSARGVRREAERRLAGLTIKAEGWATAFALAQHPRQTVA